MPESRVQKSLLNAKVNVIFYVLTLALSFFSRKIFLDCLGADFVGLTTTLQNLLTFLNLAELGVGTAIGYVLYKPLFDGNRAEITEIITILKYLYRWIGGLILGLGIILACFLPFIFPDTEFSYGIIYAAYASFLASSLIGYFINYRQTLLSADQKNYIIIACLQGSNIVKIIIQIISAWHTRNYYLWIAIELVFGCFYAFILNWKINRVYPWLHDSQESIRSLLSKHNKIIRYVRQIFLQKIGNVVQWQSAPILIYAFVNLHTVALYGNYTIIIDKVSQLSNNILESTGASIGNLLAENNIDKSISIFNELMAFRLWIGGFIVFSIYSLINPFIILWLGKEYLLSNYVLIIMLANLYLTVLGGGVHQFLFASGFFYDTWAPFVQVLINLSFGIIIGSQYGLIGVIIGVFISHLCITIGWKPCFLFTKVFHKNPITFYCIISIGIFSLFLSAYLTNLFIPVDITQQSFHSYFNWIIYAIILCLLFSFIHALFLYILYKGIKNLIKRLINKISHHVYSAS